MITGKGVYLYTLSYIEGANKNIIWPADSPERLAWAERIADRAVAARLTHVCIKVADGIYPFNVRRKDAAGNVIYNSTLPDAIDDCPLVVKALQRRGIKVYGWQFVYGQNPEAEAAMAIQRMNELGLDGWIVNAEKHWKSYYTVEVKEGKTKVTKVYENAQPSAEDLRAVGLYMAPVRAETKRLGIPLFLSSFKYPSSHPSFPFAAFLGYCDGNMPQVYPIGDSRPDAHRIQLAKSLREYRAIAPEVPIVPTGGAFSESFVGYDGKAYSWTATPVQVTDFFDACLAEGLPAANVWEWFAAAEKHPELWESIVAYDCPGDEIYVPTQGAGEQAVPVHFEDGWLARYREKVKEG